MKKVFLALLLASCLSQATADTGTPDSCDTGNLKVQVLGSGGPDLAEGRAGSSYLVWIEGKARALIDFGSGAALRFAASGARASDLDAVMLTHLHADHTLDLPELISIAMQENRTRTLPLYGPTGNRFAPSTVTFIRNLFDGTRGVYRHLGDVLNPLAKDGFRLDAQDVRNVRSSPVGPRRDESNEIIDIQTGKHMRAAATYVIHGAYPAIAWRIRVGDRHIVFSGDMNGEGGQLEQLAQKADLLIVHHAAVENASGIERYSHMPPSIIGRLAAQAGAKRVVLSHRTSRTLGQEEASLAAIRGSYSGPIVFANDMDCFAIP